MNGESGGCSKQGVGKVGERRALKKITNVMGQRLNKGLNNTVSLPSNVIMGNRHVEAQSSAEGKLANNNGWAGHNLSEGQFSGCPPEAESIEGAADALDRISKVNCLSKQRRKKRWRGDGDRFSCHQQERPQKERWLIMPIK